jgi:5-oxoprolinase (ATP-hydrolysing) subunit A
VTLARFIDLNCDLGEGMGDDAAVLPHVTSANIACGAHAGDPVTMRRTVAAAVAAGVAIGAHPGFSDRENFGRRPLPLPADEVFDLVLAQIGALAYTARPFGVRLAHVKPHGALYHVAAARPEIADAIARATRTAREDLILVGPPDSALAAAAAAHGLRFAGEIFADRNYGDDGRLLPRSHPGARVDLDLAAVAARAVAMVRDGTVTALSGKVLPQVGQTLCLHGDDPQVADRAQRLRAAFHAAGIAVVPLAIGA